jgi:hypothetical protein
MRRMLSTKTHGLLDMLMVGTLIVLPRILDWDARLVTALTVIAVMMFLLSMVTRYELGLLKLLPVKAHLAIDVLTGLTLLAAPFLFARDAEPGEIGLLAALGLFEIVTALMTERESSVERYEGLGQRV